MSAPPHDGWPQEGSVWEHWSDLLLATQLTALREGYTATWKNWDERRPSKLEIRCKVRKCTVRQYTCQHTLVHASAENPQDLTGRWVVEKLRTENLDVSQHKKHTAGAGVSQGFVQPPSKKPKLSIDQVIKDWKSMHLLEGSVRAISRREGRFLDAWSRATEYLSTAKKEYSYFFACVSGQRCSFYIRFGPHAHQNEEGWICEKLCWKHTCSSTALDISNELSKRLSFWPKPKVQGDYSAPTRRRFKERESKSTSKIERHLGDYPVLAPGQTSARGILSIFAPQRVEAAISENGPSTAKAQIVSSGKSQRTVELLKLLEEKDTAEKKSKSNPSSTQPLPSAPLSIPSTTPTSSNPLDTAQPDKLQNRQGSLVKAIDLLFSLRRLILDLEHKVSTASALDNLEGVRKYEAEKVELEKQRDDIESKVTKRKRKLERQKERMKAKQMVEKKVVGNTSNSPKVKQGRKVKKSKKEKKAQ